MEVSITDISDVEKELHVEATAADLAPHLEQAYKRYQTKAEVRGFRKGKAPLNLVKHLYGESIEYNALDTIASDVYRKIVEERNIHPIGEPTLTDIDYKRGEALTFKVKYEVKPTFELREYTGIPIEKVIHRVTDKEVEDEILRIRRANHALQEAEAVTDNEFMVTADIQQLDESGSPLIGRKTADAHLYLADEQLFPEMKESLQNAHIGDVRRAKIEREHDGHKHTDNLEITVKKIEKVNLPELTDEFVGKITKDKTKTVGEFRTNLRSDIESYWRERTERQLNDTMIAEIVRRHDFTVPETLVKGVLDSLVEDLKNQYPDKKPPADFNEEKFRENNRSHAIFQAKWYLIRERIIDNEGLKVEDPELDQLADREAPLMGIDKDRLLQFYKSSTSAKDRILSDKLMTFLRERQKITHRTTDEIIE